MFTSFESKALSVTGSLLSVSVREPQYAYNGEKVGTVLKEISEDIVAQEASLDSYVQGHAYYGDDHFRRIAKEKGFNQDSLFYTDNDVYDNSVPSYKVFINVTTVMNYISEGFASLDEINNHIAEVEHKAYIRSL